MKDNNSIAPYIYKKYKIDNDADDTAKCALNKILQSRFALSIDDVPDTYDLFDTLQDASAAISAENYELAANILTEYINEHIPVL